MKYLLRKIDMNMGGLEYEMYQDIPITEIGSSNPIYGLPFEEFRFYLKMWIENENRIDKELNTTTNRYILYVNNYPVGEIGIRTTLNDFWKTKGSQIFYKIRLPERNKGYGTKMLELALKECRKIGMKEVGINCSNANLSSQKIIQNNDGRFLFNYGESSRYLINLMGDDKI